MRILVALFFLFLFLFLGVFVFQALSDRITALEIWQSPTWATIKVPFFTLSVVGATVLLITWARASARKRLQDVQSYAFAHGWTFSREDTQGLRERAEAIYYDRSMISPSYIRAVESGARTISLFDCWHKHRNASARVREHRATVCLLESACFQGVTQPLVISEYLILNERLVGKELELDDSPFAEQFVVHAMDPEAAGRALTTSLQTAMLTYKEKSPHDSIAVAIASTGTVLMIQETLDHKRWQDLIDLARNIEAAVGQIR